MTALLKYLIAGGSAFVVEYGVFFLLFGVLHGYLYVANSMSFVCGLAVSFLLNRTWAFKQKEFRLAKRHQLLTYIGLALFNLLLINVIVGLLRALGMEPLAGKIVAMLLIVGWNFFAFRIFIFGGKPASRVD